MNVGRLAYALDASREEQGLCPHEKNPAFDAGMFIIGSGWQTAVCPVRGLSGSRFVRFAICPARVHKAAALQGGSTNASNYRIIPANQKKA